MTMTHFRTPRAGLLACAVAAAAALLPASGAQAQSMLGETRAFGFNFCPRGWMATDGQLLPISQYTALFSLLGTNYGGDGRTTFALPDYRGRAAIGVGSGPGLPNYNLGTRTGAERAQLTVANMPQHSHGVAAVSAEGDRGRPNSDYLAGGTEQIYNAGPADGLMDPASISNTGGGQPFDIRPPYLVVNWCIAVEGIFPARN